MTGQAFNLLFTKSVHTDLSGERMCERASEAVTA
jgi:hypothetical protein